MFAARTLPHYLVLECFLGRNHLPGARAPIGLKMARLRSLYLILAPKAPVV